MELRKHDSTTTPLVPFNAIGRRGESAHRGCAHGEWKRATCLRMRQTGEGGAEEGNGYVNWSRYTFDFQGVSSSSLWLAGDVQGMEIHFLFCHGDFSPGNCTLVAFALSYPFPSKRGAIGHKCFSRVIHEYRCIYA